MKFKCTSTNASTFECTNLKCPGKETYEEPDTNITKTMILIRKNMLIIILRLWY